MILDFVHALVVSVAVYGAAACLLALWLESRRPCSGDGRFKLLAMDTTVDTINFVNAVTATALSSWALVNLEDQRFDVTGGRPSGPVPDYALGSVCGYILVEILILSVTSIRLQSAPWSWLLTGNSYREMVVFHIVALVGLVSVVTRDTGYPLALWVVWSELTSVFIGLEQFMMGYGRLSSHYQQLAVIVRLCSGVLFVVQRVVIFYYLVWLCWRSFVWDIGFIAQVALLIAGTILNTHMACAFVTDLL